MQIGRMAAEFYRMKIALELKVQKQIQKVDNDSTELSVQLATIAVQTSADAVSAAVHLATSQCTVWLLSAHCAVVLARVYTCVQLRAAACACGDLIPNKFTHNTDTQDCGQRNILRGLGKYHNNYYYYDGHTASVQIQLMEQLVCCQEAPCWPILCCHEAGSDGCWARTRVSQTSCDFRQSQFPVRAASTQHHVLRPRNHLDVYCSLTAL